MPVCLTLNDSLESRTTNLYVEADCIDEERSDSERLLIPGTPQSQLTDPREETSKKRKRDLDSELDDLDASTSFDGITGSADSTHTAMLSLVTKSLLTSFAEIDESCTWNHQPTFTEDTKGADAELYSGGDQAFIKVAQVLADQLTSHLSICNNGKAHVFNAGQLGAVDVLDDPLSNVVSDIFPNAVRCDLKSYMNIGNEGAGNVLDTNLNPRSATKRQGSFPYPANASSVPSQIFNLPPPRLTVRRSDTILEVFPSAVQFWEELGLNPYHGGKDVNAYTIYPAGDAIQRGVETFIDLIGNTYQRSGLGVHSGGSGLPEYPNGLVSVSISEADSWRMMENIESACTQLGIPFFRAHILKLT